jgi:hypothetical protein
VRVSPGARLGWLLLAAVLCCPSPNSSAQSSVEDQDLILEARLHNVVLSDGIPAIQRSGMFFVPLRELTQALEFPIDVFPDSGRASGWFLNEERTFQLDVTNRSARVSGREVLCDPDRLRVEFDDIYVEISMFGVWFPVQLRVSVRNLMLRVDSLEPLPVEQRLERERRRARALAGRRLLDRPVYPRATAPHRWISWPFIDAAGSYSYHYANSADDNPRSLATYSLLATSDLAALDGQVYFAGNREDALDEILLHVGRTDPEGNLLGPLRATEFALGDVYAPQSALIAESVKGRGISLASFPLDRPWEFDRTTLQGEGAPGWEVELYRNDALIDFQVVGETGRYEFSDIPVLYGLNLLRVVLYGPQGQRREEQHRFYVGPDQIEPGRANYRIAINQHNADLIQVAGDLDDRDPRKGDARFLAEYERGIQRHLSAAFSLASLPIRAGAPSARHTYFGTELRSSLGPVYTLLNATADVRGGWAAQGAAQTRWQELNWLGEYGYFHHYRSDRIDDPDLLSRWLRARVDGGVLLPVPVSFGLDVRRTGHQSGSADTEVGNRLSLSLRRVVFSNTLDWRSFSGESEDIPDHAKGELLLNSQLYEASVRGAFRYEVRPVTRATNLILSMDRRWEEFGRLNVDINGSLAAPRRVTYSAGWNRRFRHVTLGVNGSYIDDGSFSFGTAVSVSLSRDPEHETWRIEGQSMAANGVALARVRLDRDGDGRASDGDEPVPDVEFRVNRSRGLGFVTDERGEAVITGLSAYRTADVAVNHDSFSDPFWIVEPEGYSVLPRPGVAAVMDFLVQETGAIDGTVFVRRAGHVREGSRIGVELVNGEGTVIRQTTSAHDGFYVFDMVPYGTYTIRIAEKSAVQLGLAAPPQKVTIDAANPVLSSVQLILSRAAARSAEPGAQGR